MDIRRRMLFKKKASSGGGGGSEGPINTDNYLTIEAIEDGLTAKLSVNACEYCVDGDGNWKSLAKGKTTESINAGQTLSFRGNLTPNSSYGIGIFTISKKCDLKGNCMSMLFGNNAADNYSLSGKSYAFYKLFYNCSKIINVSSNFLPATTLAIRCYYSMFEDCTSLATPPELPATTLADSCYYSMFYGCSSLTTAPALPATTLATHCYNLMFFDCSSLTTAPELPATTLADSCYYSMFRYCTKLNYIKMLATNTSASNCLYEWVKYVASKGTFVKNPDMTSLRTGTSGIPYSWRVLNSVTTPENQLKSFTIRETSTNTVWGPYKFEEGMTIYDFYESECNLDGDIITITGGYGVSFNGGNYNIFSWNEILQEQEYTFNYKTTGGEPM